MSNEELHWSDQLLASARAKAEPRSEDAERNLANIEARLAVAPDAGARGASGSGGGSASPVVQRGPVEHGPVERARITGAAPGSFEGALVKLGLVLAFGMGTGLVGYWIGRTETEQERVSSALEAAPFATNTVEANSEAASAVSPPRDPAPTPASHAASPAALTSDSRGVHPGSPAASAQVLPGASPELQPASPPSGESAVGGLSRRAAAHTRRVEADAPAAAQPSVAAEPPRAANATPAPPRIVREATSAGANEAPTFELGEALELLRRAEAAVRRGDGLEARMWLSDLERRAPRALLFEERLVTATLASCLLDDVDAASETLRELERSNPESMYRARLEGSCVADRLGQAPTKRQ